MAETWKDGTTNRRSASQLETIVDAYADSVGSSSVSPSAGGYTAAGNYLNIPWATGAVTPNQAGLAVGTSTLDLRTEVALDSWVNGAYQTLITQFGFGTNPRFGFWIAPTGALEYDFYNNVAGTVSALSSVILGFAAGTRKWIRVLHNVAAGTVDFYTSLDGSSWTSLGVQRTGLATTTQSTATPASPLQIGQEGSDYATGRFYQTQVIVGGVTIINMNWTTATPGPGTWTATTGEVWTRVNNSQVMQQPVTGAWIDTTTTSRAPFSLETALNVKTYGAKGDGATDDTTAIQQALDKVAMIGGGIVFLPPGTYMTTGIVINSNVTLRGSGVNATIIKLIGGTTGDLLKTKNFATLTGGTTSTAPNNFHLREITLDADEMAGTIGWVARIFGYAYTVDHVEFWNGKLGGVWSEWYNDGNIFPQNMEAHWSNFNIKEYSCSGDGLNSGAGYGLYWAGPHDSVFNNGFISTLKSFIRPQLWDNTGGKEPSEVGFGGTIGCYLTGGGFGSLLNQVHVWGRNHFGIYPGGCNVYATNCESEGAFKVNFVLTLSSVWTGGLIYGNGTDGEVGVQIGTPSGNCSRAILTGVFMNNFVGANSAPFNSLSSAGNNIIQAVGAFSAPTWIKGSPYYTGDHFELICHNNPNINVVTHPHFMYCGDGFNVRTKTGAPGSGSSDFTTTVLPTEGAIMFDTTNLNLNVLTSGVWYGTPLVATTKLRAIANITYSASMTPNAADGPIQKIAVTNGTAMTINAPTNPVTGLELTFDILNSSGGAMGTITWNAAFKLAGSFTNPASTKHRTIRFFYDGTNWIEINRAAADI